MRIDLVNAAQAVIDHWQDNGLAAAVRNLSAAVSKAKRAELADELLAALCECVDMADHDTEGFADYVANLEPVDPEDAATVAAKRKTVAHAYALIKRARGF